VHAVARSERKFALRARLAVCFVLVLVASGASAQDVASPAAVTLQLPAGRVVKNALAIDVDGDGATDLLLSETDEHGGRSLALHLQKTSGAAFRAEPDASLALTADVVAYAVADVHADAGSEVVLFAAQAVFAWRWRAEESARFVKLVDCEFLWQLPDKKEAFEWQAGVVDVDGDGLPDLALPFAGGWRIALQRRKDGTARFDAVADLHVPDDGDARSGKIGFGARKKAAVSPPGSRRNVTVSMNEGGFTFENERANGAPLVRVSENVPAAQFVDWDGDGDLDLMCMSTDEVFVFVQEPRGIFSDEHRLALRNPVVADRERELDVSYGASVLDLDGDRRADCVIFAGDKRSKDVRTQALVFLHAPARAGAEKSEGDPLFGVEGVPTQLLVFGGFARALGLQDVDGDGLPDLLVGAIRPDLIDELRAASTERIDAEIYAYRNTGHGFAKRPDLSRKLSLPAANTQFSLDFIGDVDGDRMSEMLVREEKDRLRLYAIRRAKGSWTVVDAPLWELAVDPDAELLLARERRPFVRDVFAVGKKEIRCIRVR
jgi:hypothetical protein